MKKLIFALMLTLMVASLHAQIDLKTNTLGDIILSPDVSAEFAVAENISVEPTIGAVLGRFTLNDTKMKSAGVKYALSGKYYFGPDNGIDKFYAGIFLRGAQVKYTGDAAENRVDRNRLGAGIAVGYKWVSSKNVVFEIGTGIGRKIVDKWSNAGKDVNLATIPGFGFDTFIKFNVGYRFGGDGGTSSSSKRR